MGISAIQRSVQDARGDRVRRTQDVLLAFDTRKEHRLTHCCYSTARVRRADRSAVTSGAQPSWSRSGPRRLARGTPARTAARTTRSSRRSARWRTRPSSNLRRTSCCSRRRAAATCAPGASRSSTAAPRSRRRAPAPAPRRRPVVVMTRVDRRPRCTGASSPRRSYPAGHAASGTSRPAPDHRSRG